MPLDACTGAIAGYLIGKITLQLCGAYFVLASLAFVEALKLICINWDSLMGLTGIAFLDIPFLSSALGGDKVSYYLMWILVGILLSIVYQLIHSSICRRLVAISENKKMAERIGIYVYRFTIGVLLLSTSIAGLAGVLCSLCQLYQPGFVLRDLYRNHAGYGDIRW